MGESQNITTRLWGGSPNCRYPLSWLWGISKFYLIWKFAFNYVWSKDFLRLCLLTMINHWFFNLNTRAASSVFAVFSHESRGCDFEIGRITKFQTLFLLGVAKYMLCPNYEYHPSRSWGGSLRKKSSEYFEIKLALSPNWMVFYHYQSWYIMITYNEYIQILSREITGKGFLVRKSLWSIIKLDSQRWFLVINHDQSWFLNSNWEGPLLFKKVHSITKSIDTVNTLRLGNVFWWEKQNRKNHDERDSRLIDGIHG